jgi:hypothetical protein
MGWEGGEINPEIAEMGEGKLLWREGHGRPAVLHLARHSRVRGNDGEMISDSILQRSRESSDHGGIRLS